MEIKNILIGCERSQVVTSAFLSSGLNCFSNDIDDSYGPFPEKHLKMDIFEAVQLQKWDLLIAHPPCTYLCKAQLWKCSRNNERYIQMIKAIEFIKKIWSLDIERICIENPIGCLSTMWRRPDQIIYPWWFGDKHSKDICLWLKNLPPLIATIYNTQRIPMRNHVNSRMLQADKSTIKSKFFPLVAEAFVNQWCF
jgi:hypothetical protein